MATVSRAKRTEQPTRSSRTKLPRYEPVLELPPLPFEHYTALRDNIALRGVMVPILVDSDGPVRRIIDGSHRKRIADELGYECPEIVATGLSEEELRIQARALNLARRQLSQEQKRQIIADQLRETPGRSNRWIGKQLGVHHATVAAVRSGLEVTGQIIQCGTRLGADDRTQPAHKPPYRIEADGATGYTHEPLVPAAPADDEPEVSLDDFDEEAVLRAAAAIRQRRVAEELRKAQKRRRATQSAPMKNKRSTPVLHGDCNDLIPTLADGSIALVVTSPPYAEQRAGHYEGIPEEVYPEYTVRWMAALWPKLTTDGSVLIVIRPHLRDGVISDYVLRTRLALRDAGWNECEELAWYKPNSPPLGSKLRPRRAWESVLWFSRSRQPYCDLKACGKASDRLGFDGSVKFAEDGVSEKTAWHPCVESFGHGAGTARVTDVFVAPVGSEEPGVDHPAVYPVGLAEQLIRTFSQEGDLVLDPFCGSGQTLLAAKSCGRRYLGIEREERYVQIALGRLAR